MSPNSGYDASGGRVAVMPSSGEAFVVFRLSEIPKDLDERSNWLTEVRHTDEQKTAFDAPLVVIFFEPSATPQELQWLSDRGVIILEESSEMRGALESLKQGAPTGESRHKEEHWAEDEHAYLVLSEPAEPQQQVSPEQVYQAVLDVLNDRSGQRR